MSAQVKEEQFSDEEDRVVVQQQVQRVDVKAEEPAEYLLIIPPKEEPKEPEEIEPDNDGQVATIEDRKFKCDYFDCDYIGKTKSRLKSHQRTHTKPFECKDCDKRFGNNQDFKDHRLVKHENPNAF